MSSVSGYIVASAAAREFTAKDFTLTKPEVARGPTLRHVGQAYESKHWEEFELLSPIPLADEPEGLREGYTYQLFVVRGFAKVILLAARRKMVDYAMTQILDRQVSPNLRKVAIHVDRMIEFCRQSDSEFLVTSLHGRFAGPSTNLRSVSLYGDDVTQSSLYVEQHGLFNFHSGGLGRRLFKGLPRVSHQDDGEIVRISTDGFLNLNLNSRSRAQELTRVVSFVMANRWVDDWVPGKGEASWQT